MQVQLQMTDGPLTGGGDVVVVDDDASGLRHDVHCILMECHRDRGLAGFLRDDVAADVLVALAADVARRLGPRIGGRYVPKRDEKALRDAAVIRRWDGGATREQIMREFSISRRLSYTITTAALKGRRTGRG